ncbi:hypothetical protein [Microvirga brassicacearum]|uniref:Uncharacterized protein n=1 Tax=Microvirga brassicacearum TaxID=2580413 RepID=A0A5N3P4Y4_9HYPH|nr:hypothetical protein [Microvirga brassicacearum]KAB0264765.1 hypothetical protein FEZ63_21595 [Microvirga brassicacearum]
MLTVVQVQPGALRNWRCLELVVDGRGIARQERRRLRQALQEIVDRGHLLIEAEGERSRSVTGMVLDSISFHHRARDQQSRRDKTCGKDDRREG